MKRITLAYTLCLTLCLALSPIMTNCGLARPLLENKDTLTDVERIANK